jgi:hypothetical protein
MGSAILRCDGYVKSMDNPEAHHELEDAARQHILGIIMPLWIAAGVGDYLIHRRTKIERTAGLPESLLHLSQMTFAGIPTLAGMFFEVTPLSLWIMVASLGLHEASAIWDVSYAEPRRGVTTTEQHLHGMLEMLPLSALSVLFISHRKQALAMIGRGDETTRWTLELKARPLPAGVIALVLGSVALFVGLPYAEELYRCAVTRPDGSSPDGAQHAA